MAETRKYVCKSKVKDDTRKQLVVYQEKQHTAKSLQEMMRKFALDFKGFNRGQPIVSTPQADLGIGPVKYNMQLQQQRATDVEELKKLNAIIKFEKEKGDMLIKFDAALLVLATGREDPWSALPALLRIATRVQIQEYVSICLSRTHKLNERIERPEHIWNVKA